jgi:hypothetical protein
MLQAVFKVHIISMPILYFQLLNLICEYIVTNFCSLLQMPCEYLSLDCMEKWIVCKFTAQVIVLILFFPNWSGRIPFGLMLSVCPEIGWLGVRSLVKSYRNMGLHAPAWHSSIRRLIGGKALQQITVLSRGFTCTSICLALH